MIVFQFSVLLYPELFNFMGLLRACYGGNIFTADFEDIATGDVVCTMSEVGSFRNMMEYLKTICDHVHYV